MRRSIANDNKGSSYITTAIPYVNARPHLGFALEAVVTDAIARRLRRRGRDVRFVTGTDDHSLKNVLAAERAGLSVPELVGRHAQAFGALRGALDLSFDDFVRTSADARHRTAVLALFRACFDRGDLYRRAYRGLYCVGCESFYEPAELEGGVCPEHGSELEEVEEENWFFRLSRYRDALYDAAASGRLSIQPESALEETLAFLRGPVRDLSVSRSARRARGWGIPVPGDPSQVIYVWFDALATYLSALGFGGADDSLYRRYWVESGERIHVIGKGITRFHTVFWPAFLASAGVPPPTSVLVHGYLTVNGVKISKSGLSIDPAPLAARYGSDALRYYLLRHVRTARDGDFRIDRLEEAYGAELANQIGNLVGRSLGLAERIAGGAIPEAGPEGEGDVCLREEALSLGGRVDEAVSRFALHDAVAAYLRLTEAANRYVDRTAPWALAREGRLERARAALRVLLETVRVLGEELAPFLPASAAKIRSLLSAPEAASDDAPSWNALPAGAPARRGEPLFPRIEASATDTAAT